jgi:predicted site-specific integrase-resolvase
LLIAPGIEAIQKTYPGAPLKKPNISAVAASSQERRYDPNAYRTLGMKRSAIYLRVSTDKQTIENQLRELRQIAARRGWEVVHEYHDAGTSGAKSREARPGLDQMLKGAQRRRFDVVMAWAIDRLGRSLIDLLGTIQALEACGIDLYLDQQSIDTPPQPRALCFRSQGRLRV